MWKHARSRQAAAVAASLQVASALLLGAALLVSCQSTAPPVNDPGILALLPPHAASYFFVDVGENRGLVRTFIRGAGVDPSSLDPVVERTRYLYGAFASEGTGAATSGRLPPTGAVPPTAASGSVAGGTVAGGTVAEGGNIVGGTAQRRGESPLFFVIGTGSYPGFLFGAALSRSGEWQKRTISVAGRSRDYWQQKAGRLQVALSDRGQLLASNGGITTLFSREQRGLLDVPAVPTEITREFALRAALFYAPSPPESAVSGGAPGLSFPGAGSLPIGNLLVLIDRAAAESAAGRPARSAGSTAAESGTERYRLEVSFDARSERDARTLSVVTKLAAAAMLASIGQPAVETMKTLDVSTTGRSLRARGISLTADQLSQLVFQFVGPSGIK
ncbi:hypothetical protein [Salinispira pacifica]